jgi:hypothetical protein
VSISPESPGTDFLENEGAGNEGAIQEIRLGYINSCMRLKNGTWACGPSIRKIYMEATGPEDDFLELAEDSRKELSVGHGLM